MGPQCILYEIFRENEVSATRLGSTFIRPKVNTVYKGENSFRVFVKNDDPPLTRKENDRLFQKLRELRAEEEEGVESIYKITKRKLYKADTVIDEFNLSNQIF